MILIGDLSLNRVVSNFVQHNHADRNHQGLDNELVELMIQDRRRRII